MFYSFSNIKAVLFLQMPLSLLVTATLLTVYHPTIKYCWPGTKIPGFATASGLSVVRSSFCLL